MLPEARVREAERLLAEGILSHRKIAMALGISRATVSSIASGQRPDYEARRALRAKELEPPGPLERCRECGGMVYTPCLLCRARRARDQRQDAARRARQQARDRAARRLLEVVWRDRQQNAKPQAGPHLPDVAAGGSPCR